MKIAVLHNFMDNIGGAEYVDLILARELKADIYTTNINYEKIKRMGFKKVNIQSIGKIPINAPFRQQLALQRFRSLNLKNKYDLYIIAGDWAMSAAVNNKPNLWYVYSPIREIYDLHNYVRQSLVSPIKRPLFDIWVKYNRYLNRKYIRHVEKIACISNNTKKRLKKYLNRDSTVIYPPTETKNYKYKENGDFWLSVNRLITHKRVDMQIKAFKNLPNEKLIIVGSYEKSRHFKSYANYIKKIKPKNVEILSWINQKELINLYAGCKALITTSKDEDYGLTPVEAMASGKPTIAPNEGGYKETIINNITGKLINNINYKKLTKAVKSLKNPEQYKSACLKHAKNFDTKIFIKKIKELIKQ